MTLPDIRPPDPRDLRIASDNRADTATLARLAAGAHATVTPPDVATLLGVSLDAAQDLCAEVRPLRVARRGSPVWRWGAVLERLEVAEAVVAPPSPIQLAEVAPRRPGRRP